MRFIPIENGIELRITNDEDVLWVIKPFTERLFRATFYQRESINCDYKFFVEVAIKTLIENVAVLVNVFYYRSDRNPFVPERVIVRRNLNLTEYLNQPYFIGLRTSLQLLPPPTYNPDDVELSLPKPIKKTFKENQCAICLDRIPNVLFVKCRHVCVCSVCEEAHPSTQCPCCRTGISEKLLI